MTDDELLADLLLRWEELHEKGQEPAAEELCRDSPHLAPLLAERIHALKVTAWMEKPDDNGGIQTDPPGPDAPLTLAGRYRLDAKIAEGGFAEVWKGFDLELRRAVAVKLPKAGRLVSTERFMAEARRVAGLEHIGVVQVFDVGREGELCFIVSRLVEGGSLAERIAKNRPATQEAVRLVAEVAETLAFAHRQGFVHRDIKPGNILIDQHGRALLTDFGIARSPDDGAESGAVSFGTLAYMSPEQVEEQAVDHRADIYCARRRPVRTVDRPASPSGTRPGAAAERDRVRPAAAVPQRGRRVEEAGTNLPGVFGPEPCRPLPGRWQVGR